MKLVLLILAYALSMVGANLSFKYAAQATGVMVVIWFIVGNIVGFVCPIVITLALKIGSPNLVYAMCLGIGFALLQVCSAILFKESLSVWQWGGIACIAAGVVFLQVR